MRDAIRMQGWTPEFDRPPGRYDDMDFRGVLRPGWFNCNITFSSLDDAIAAAREFRAAGYVVELLDDVDDFSNTTWITVSKFAGDTSLDDMFRAADALANAFNGCADAHWIDEGKCLG